LPPKDPALHHLLLKVQHLAVGLSERVDDQIDEPDDGPRQRTLKS
jgi:hypothetical protein